jgi:hypothetical protein
VTASGVDHEYPPADWSFDELGEALEPPRKTDSLPRYDEAAAWKELADDALTRPAVEEIRSLADDARDEPVGTLPATRYLQFERTGDRIEYERVYFGRQKRLSALALAECFDREGRYLDAVLDHAWAICEQTTWLLPAHLPDEERIEGLPSAAEPTEHRVALFSARTALLLAEVDRLLSDRLHPALRERIRREIDHRVFTPYLEGDHHWLHPPVGNWNAVCNAAVATAALHLESDVDRLARLVNRAVDSLRHYLASFDDDGCTPEGLGYWNFGFGHYLMLAAALDARTDGAFDLLSPPVVEAIARYPDRIELSPGRYVPFSDAHEGVGVAPYAACWAGDRLDLPELSARGRAAFASQSALFSRSRSDHLSEVIRNLVWSRSVPADLAVPPPPERTYFGGHSWWLARGDPTDPGGLAVAAKGGHNGEPHNHNDCGSFVVHYRGESLLTDLGPATYDRDYFDPEERYSSLATRSLGHSVPYVDGSEQVVDEEYAATVVARSTGATVEEFVVDLADCYPSETELDSLERRVRLNREAGDDGRFSVEDTVRFEADASDRRWESVLVSYFPIRETDRGLTVTGERSRARIDAANVATVEVERLAGALSVTPPGEYEAQRRDVWRARLAPASVEETLQLVVEPEPRDGTETDAS